VSSGWQCRSEQLLNAPDESGVRFRFVYHRVDASRKCYFFYGGIGKGGKQQERGLGHESFEHPACFNPI